MGREYRHVEVSVKSTCWTPPLAFDVNVLAKKGWRVWSERRLDETTILYVLVRN